MIPQKGWRGLIYIPVVSIYNIIAQILVVCWRWFLIMHLKWQVITARVSEQSLNVTSATPEITTKQQQASNNSLLASLLNDINIKAFKRLLFYLAGPGAAGIFILFIAGANANMWRERLVSRRRQMAWPPPFRRGDARWLRSATAAAARWWWWICASCSPVDCVLQRSRRELLAPPPKAFTPFSYVNGWRGGGWKCRGGKKKSLASISLNDLLM